MPALNSDTSSTKPRTANVATLAKVGWLTLRGRQSDAAETLLRSVYAYRDGGTAWDAFPEEWRRAGRENAGATLAWKSPGMTTIVYGT